MKEGQEIEFNCYGKTVKGTFIEEKNNLIFINVTQDDLLNGNVGTKQVINKHFLITPTNE